MPVSVNPCRYIVPKADAYLPAFNGETGDLIHKIPTPHYLRLRRKEFVRVLGEGIDIQVRSLAVCL